MNSLIQSVCVYCSASNNVAEIYKDYAAETGQILAQKNITVVYGGGCGGLMGILADNALQQDGRVIGVLPESLKERELAHTNLSELHVTKTLQERQTKMAALADAFLILPGGLGTMAEFFEIVTWKQLGFHNKPIAILNIQNYWGPLLSQLNHAKDEHFFHTDNALFKTFDNLSKALTFLCTNK